MENTIPLAWDQRGAATATQKVAQNVEQTGITLARLIQPTVIWPRLKSFPILIGFPNAIGQPNVWLGYGVLTVIVL